MEYLVAGLALLIAAGYAAFIAVNIEKGKPWAIDIAKAVSMLDPGSIDHHLRQELQRERPVETPKEADDSHKLAA